LMCAEILWTDMHMISAVQVATEEEKNIYKTHNKTQLSGQGLKYSSNHARL